MSFRFLDVKMEGVMVNLCYPKILLYIQTKQDIWVCSFWSSIIVSII